ncbi:hypothetical protein BOTBODRAFT_212956 [Botryobasidium botryosum FD-172 SS1]|uniref:Uncharacterized protein n=1 Tax=Botryobasidium botryosum (strain FD-172 SS1) TaxID=930990 RepID=A0A067N1N2_BOTB1|nr:hypothetical protein BOTBODRAFT_212956 [Botryobasidium botryosum FD-172 SS1]
MYTGLQNRSMTKLHKKRLSRDQTTVVGIHRGFLQLSSLSYGSGTAQSSIPPSLKRFLTGFFDHKKPIT